MPMKIKRCRKLMAWYIYYATGQVGVCARDSRQCVKRRYSEQARSLVKCSEIAIVSDGLGALVIRACLA
jgi:hypothetical protein